MAAVKSTIEAIAENKSAEWIELYRKETDMNKLIMLADAFSSRYDLGKNERERIWLFVFDWQKTFYFSKEGKITKVVDHGK